MPDNIDHGETNVQFNNVIPKAVKPFEYPIIGLDFDADQIEHYVSFAAYNVREVTSARWERTQTKYKVGTTKRNSGSRTGGGTPFGGELGSVATWSQGGGTGGLLPGGETIGSMNRTGGATTGDGFDNTIDNEHLPTTRGMVDPFIAKIGVQEAAVSHSWRTALPNTARMGNTISTKAFAIPETIINLYQPQNLSVAYGQNWSEEEGISTEFSTANMPTGEKWMETMGSHLKSMFQQGLDAGTKGLQDAAFTKTAEAGLGIVTNSRIGLLFKKTGLRTFQFSFNFMPKSEQEVKMVMDIITRFKWHAAPQIDKNYDSIYNYPELWKIEFHKGNDINQHLFKTTWSALTNIALNYSPQGVWATFKDGMPVNVQMDLTFMEIEAIDKKFIKAGY